MARLDADVNMIASSGAHQLCLSYDPGVGAVPASSADAPAAVAGNHLRQSPALNRAKHQHIRRIANTPGGE